MRNGSLLLIAVGVMALGSTVRAKEDQTAVRTTLQRNYETFTRAMQKKDVAGWRRLLAPDFRAKRPDGYVANRAEAERDISGTMMSMTSFRWPRKIEKLEVSGNRAIATVRGRLNGVTKVSDGSTHKMQFDGLTRDTWIRTKGAWKLRLSELKESKMLMDGKPVGGPGAQRS